MTTAKGLIGSGAGMVKAMTPKFPTEGVIPGVFVRQPGPPFAPPMVAVKVTVSSCVPGPFSIRTTFVGAETVIVRAGEVLGQGWNQVLGKNDPTAHAEMVAIRSACRRVKSFKLAGAVIYSSCEPCPMCLSALYWARVERVVHACDRADAARAGFDDEVLYTELASAPERRRLPIERFLREEALVAFETWLAKPDRTPY